MEVQALTRNARMSPKKVREVARTIQGRKAAEAVDYLMLVPRKSAKLIAKTLKSAIANAENNNNLSADALGGAIPLVGDIWDFLFRAHARNHALLQERAASGGQIRTRPTDILVVAGAALLFLAALAAPIVVAVVLVRAIVS